MTLLRITAIVFLGLLLSGQASQDSDLDSAFSRDTLIISADQHACYFFDIYVASSRAQQMRGLMNVRELPEMTGMIFVYRRAEIHSMWMKNTYISLDIIFALGDGRISSLTPDTVPLSLASLRRIGGRSSTSITSPRVRIMQRSTTLRSSRTLPGHG